MISPWRLNWHCRIGSKQALSGSLRWASQLEAHIEQLKGAASTGEEEDPNEDQQETETPKKKVVTSISNLAKNPLDPSP